ncbi:MAG: class I adenylate-forming enzyme family protein [Pseudomonadota bacterium]
MTKTIVDILFDRARASPQMPFLTWQGEVIPYGAFAGQVLSAAATLRDEGVVVDDRVAICVRDKLTHLLAYFGAMAAGAIAVHVWSRRTPEEVAWACRHVGAKVLVGDDGTAEPGRATIATSALVRSKDTPALTARPSIAYMMFTSGTTSLPKAVMTTHRNVEFVTDTLIRIGSLMPDDREMIYMPLHATGGLGHVHGLIARGASAHLTPHDLWSITDDDLHAMLDLIEAETVTAFLTTISLLDRLRSTHRAAFQQKARCVRAILVNVAPLPSELVADLIGILPATRFVHYYGSTEASRSVVQCFNDNPNHYHCAGWPAHGTSFTLEKDDNHGGSVGEIAVRGPQVMLGYWQGTVERDDGRARTFRTGDLGTVDAAGALTVLGRVNDNINVDGLKVFPFMLEDVLRAHPDVAECVVAGIPHPRTFQTPGTAVVPRDGVNRHDLAMRLCAHCREKLDPMLVPSRYLVVDRLPRGEQGKVLRQKVAEMIARRGVDPTLASRDPTARTADTGG